MSLLLFVLAAAAAPAATVPAEVSASAKPLYTFDKDDAGVSNCLGGCARTWPPLVAPEGARPVGNWTVIKREDGPNQWAINGKPVYTYADDTGATPTGDGEAGAWHVVKLAK